MTAVHDPLCHDAQCECMCEAACLCDLISEVEERFSGWLSPEEVEGQMELVRVDEREKWKREFTNRLTSDRKIVSVTKEEKS